MSRLSSTATPNRNATSIEKERSVSLDNPLRSIHSTTPDPKAPERTRERVKRPPPPSVDLAEIAKSVERSRTLQLRNQHTNDSSTFMDNRQSLANISHNQGILSPDTMLNTHKMSSRDSIDPVAPEQRPDSIYQHKRERSQAEELVDDIDIYLRNYKEASKSPTPIQMDDNVDVSHTPNEHPLLGQTVNTDDNLIVQIPSNVSVEEVSPLLFGSAQQNIPKLYSSSDNDSIVHETSGLKITNRDSDDESVPSSKFSYMESDESTPLNEPEISVTTKGNVDQDMNSDIAKQTSFKSTNPFLLNDGQESTNHSSSLRIANITNNSSVEGVSDDNDVFYDKQETPLRSRSTTADADLDLEPRRHFRITNEDRPTFYAPYDSDSDSSSFTSYRPSVTSPREVSADPMESSHITPTEYATPNDSPIKGSESNNLVECGENSTMTSLDNDSSDVYASVNASTSQLSSKNGFESTDNLKSVSTPGSKSIKSVQSNIDQPSRPDKPSRLVSSYVEELRLKYYKTSNFLEAPPNLPMALKQKNNLIQPKNVKVALRTSSKQVGIKHGRVKQKLLALEATTDDSKSLGSANISSIDHTKEFHKLLGKDDVVPEEDENESEEYLNEIPGDEAYDSEDCMAPLREKRGSKVNGDVTRSNTTVSYYTRLQNRPRSGTVDRMKSYNYKLPTNILDDYKENEEKNASKNSSAKRNPSTKTIDSSAFLDSYLGDGGLRLANPDSEDD